MLGSGKMHRATVRHAPAARSRYTVLELTSTTPCSWSRHHLRQFIAGKLAQRVITNRVEHGLFLDIVRVHQRRDRSRHPAEVGRIPRDPPTIDLARWLVRPPQTAHRSLGGQRGGLRRCCSSRFLRRCAMFARINREMRRHVWRVDREVLRCFQAYDWPGNVRELENALMKAMALCRADVITCDLLSERICSAPTARRTTDEPETQWRLRDVERAHVLRAFESTGWRRGYTCEILGISRPRLRRLIRQYGIAVPACAAEDSDDGDSAAQHALRRPRTPAGRPGQETAATRRTRMMPLAELDRILRLRSNPIGMKLFDAVEAMSAVPRIRRAVVGLRAFRLGPCSANCRAPIPGGEHGAPASPACRFRASPSGATAASSMTRC